MNVRRLQGLALMLSGVCLLVGLADPNTTLTHVSFLISTLLFILGIPGIYTVQPTSWVKLVGIVLLELAALIALGFQLDLVPSSVSDSLSLTSAILGMLGGVIIGWLTIREHVFPAWVGWLFLTQGLLNLIAGLFNLHLGVLPLFLPVLQAVALLAYGYFIYRNEKNEASLSRTVREKGVSD